MKNIIISLLFLFISSSAFAWNGEDTDSGQIVTVHGSEFVNDGDTIFYTLGESEEYQSGTVISIFSFGSDIQIQVRDEAFGDIRLFTMEKTNDRKNLTAQGNQ
ncbi:MAG: DUF5334 family protein [Gammaproteobacteria bacterium]|nr:DUF5334 family protein [Gammaproteobacteria bacterium]